MTRLVVCAILTGALTASAHGQTNPWHKELEKQLPLLGHRNWIVVADSAYPAQTAPGIKTIYTGEKQLDAVRKVLAKVKQAKHVRGTVFLDAELPHVPDKLAKGINDYRSALQETLKGQTVTSLPHSEIIEQLDTAGQTFTVLLLKTDMTLPYTSVFIRLDCGYWSDEAESQLRKAMATSGPAAKKQDP